MPTDMQRTNIYLSPDDRALAEAIKEAQGLASLSSVVRFALRRVGRTIQAEQRRRQPPAARDDAGEGEGL